MNFLDEACGSSSTSSTKPDSKVNLQTKVKEEKKSGFPKPFKVDRLAIKFPVEVPEDEPDTIYFETGKDSILEEEMAHDIDLIDFGDDDEDDADRIRKPSVRTEKKRRFNVRLCKVLMPKNALILLHELKPECIYKVIESKKTQFPLFIAEIIYKDSVLGKGEGPSKSTAKVAAAEQAVREIITRTMIRLNAPEIVFNDDCVVDSMESLPWVGICSYAVFKLFCTWNQIMATEYGFGGTNKKKVFLHFPEMFSIEREEKKNVPPNALDMHPVMVLNHMYPGLPATELERSEGPCRVTMGYEINGKLYCGVGGNKKDAKKEAAKTVLRELHGLVYPPSLIF